MFVCERGGVSVCVCERGGVSVCKSVSVCVLQAISCLTDLICNFLQFLLRSAHNHNI